MQWWRSGLKARVILHRLKYAFIPKRKRYETLMKEAKECTEKLLEFIDRKNEVSKELQKRIEDRIEAAGEPWLN